MRRRDFITTTATSLLAACTAGRALPRLRGEPVLVIGAGMAGLAAARRLREAGAAPVILEARSRIGGRIHSLDGFADEPIELGAELVHGVEAPTWPLIRRAGLMTHPLDGVAMLSGGRLTPDVAHEPSPAEQEAIAGALGARPDRPLADCLQGWPVLLESIGTDLDQARQSCHATLEVVGDPERLSGDFLVRGGYARLPALLAAGLDIRSGVRIRGLQVTSAGVEATADDGRRFEGAAAIVTVPLGVLRDGRLAFEPALPPAVQDAIRRLGVADVVKLFYRFARPVLPRGTEMLALPGARPSRFWARPPARPDGEQVVVGWVTADAARQVMERGEAFAVEEGLATLHRLGSLPPLLGARWSEWNSDPFARGAYSMTPVGAHGARAALVAPVHGRLFLAGEHTGADGSERAAFTVHGAMLSGEAAAQRAAAALRRNA